MNQIKISGKHKGKFFIVDDEDYEEFSKYTWYLDAYGYPSTTIKAHQMSLGMFKRNGKNIIDHKNGNRIDNRKSNLRFATRAQNMQNKKRDYRNKAGYKGVVKRNKNSDRPYVAFIGGGKSGKQIYLGAYEKVEDAAKAYDTKALELFGEFARLNFPED